MESGEFIQFIIMVIILGLVGLFTWVRKSIEKMQAGQKGEKLDVGRSVRDQIRRYMQAAGYDPGASGAPGRSGSPSGGTAAPAAPPPKPPAPPAPAPPARPAKPPTAEPRRPPERSRPVVVERRRPARRARSIGGRRGGYQRVGGRRIHTRPLGAPGAGSRSSRSILSVGERREGARRRLTREMILDAVILAELLGPPIAERQDYRLF